MQTRLRRTAIGAALLASMLAAGCGDEDASPPWRVVIENQPGALFGVWGSAENDVWLAGSDARDGSGPLVFHWNGNTLLRKVTGLEGGDLFWVWGDGLALWFVGQRGGNALILRHRRDDGRFESFPGPAATTLYGVLPLSATEVIAVGEAKDAGGTLLRFDGAAFTPDPAFGATPGSVAAFFKVWGRAPDDVWVVGRGGRAQHRTAAGWREVAVPAQRPLFTVHGNQELTIAVGGQQGGLIVEALGGPPIDVTPVGAPQLNGVFVTGDSGALAVGIGGAIWQREGARWRPAEGPATSLDYHAIYVDPKGGAWAVGGQVTVPPFSRGLVVRRDAAR